MNPKTILDTVVLARIGRVAHLCGARPALPGARKVSAALALLASLLFCQAALASDIAHFEGEDMAHGTFAAETTDPSAENGIALRYEDNGTASYKINLTSPANEIKVRSRNATASTGGETINLVVDGVTQKAQSIGSDTAGKTYALRSWPVNLSAGAHTIGVKGGGLSGVDKLLVDNVRLGGSTTSPAVTTSCDKYASTNGSDSNTGTETKPYRTVDKLGESLSAGQTGCVRGGIYDQDVHLSNGGTTSSPITIKAYPGESVDFRGTFEVNGSNVIIDGFADMRGEYADTTVGAPYDPNEVKTWPAVEPNGTNITVKNIGLIENQLPSDPYNHSGQAIQAGPSSDGLKILASRIGAYGEPNGGNNHQHAIYIGSDNFQIRDNIFNPGKANGDRGIQMYKDADNGVIEGNIFREVNDVAILVSGSGSVASDNNEISGNVIAYSREDLGIKTYTGQSSAGAFYGNSVHDNCGITGLNVADSPDGSGIEANMPGATLSGNIMANPLFDSQDRIQAGTACAAKFTGPTSNTY